MSLAKVVRCPHCGWKNEVSCLDSLRRIASVEKPNPNDVHGDIKETIHDCQNPECLRPFTVYWYEQKRFFEKA